MAFDVRTRRLVGEVPVAAEHLRAVKLMAGVPPEDPEAVGSYPLTEKQRLEIEKLIGRALNPGRWLLFLEPPPEPLDDAHHQSVGARRLG